MLSVDFHVPHEKEEIVQGSNMIPQERVFQRQVEQIVEVPMPMAQKEMVLVPTVVHHHSHHHVEQEVIVDDHVPLRKINHQERIIQQTVEEVVEVPVPMAQEEIMHVPMVVNHRRHHHVEQGGNSTGYAPGPTSPY